MTFGAPGDPAEALAAFQFAAKLAHSHPDTQSSAIRAARDLVDHMFAAGDLLRAQQYAETALQLSADGAFSADLAYLHLRLATIRAVAREYATALGHYQEAFDLCERLNDTAGTLEALLHIAYMQFNLGSFDAAMGNLHRAEERAASLQDLGHMARARTLQAQTVFVGQQDFERALSLLLRAAEIAEGADCAFAYIQAANTSLSRYSIISTGCGCKWAAQNTLRCVAVSPFRFARLWGYCSQTMAGIMSELEFTEPQANFLRDLSNRHNPDTRGERLDTHAVLVDKDLILLIHALANQASYDGDHATAWAWMEIGKLVVQRLNQPHLIANHLSQQGILDFRQGARSVRH